MVHPVVPRLFLEPWVCLSTIIVFPVSNSKDNRLRIWIRKTWNFNFQRAELRTISSLKKPCNQFIFVPVRNRHSARTLGLESLEEASVVLLSSLAPAI